MLPYIGQDTLKTILRDIGIEPFLLRLIDYLAADYARWDAFDKAPRTAAHSPVGVIEVMPISDGHYYAFKYVNGHPHNTQIGKLTVTAFGVLADVATGYPLIISEMTILTALRTAATSALAAKYLVKGTPKTMAIIGCGAQAEFQAHAFHAVFGIRDVRIFDTDPAAMEKFIQNLTPKGFNITPCTNAHMAVTGVDIITLATAAKARQTVLTPDMLPKNWPENTTIHINAIGGDCPGKTELHPDILRHAQVVVELEEQSRIEGDIQQTPDVKVTLLADLVRNKVNMAEHHITATAATADAANGLAEHRVTVFDSVGFALEDFSAMRLIYDIAQSRQVPQLDMVPQLTNPKNLYGMLT